MGRPERAKQSSVLWLTERLILFSIVQDIGYMGSRCANTVLQFSGKDTWFALVELTFSRVWLVVHSTYGPRAR